MVELFSREKYSEPIAPYIEKLALNIYHHVREARFRGESFNDSSAVLYTGPRIGLSIETLVEFSTSQGLPREEYLFGDVSFVEPDGGKITPKNELFFSFTKGRMFEYFFKREVPLFYAVHNFTIPKKLLNIPRPKKPESDKTTAKKTTIYIPDPISTVSPRDIRLMRRDIKRRETN